MTAGFPLSPTRKKIPGTGRRRNVGQGMAARCDGTHSPAGLNKVVVFWFWRGAEAGPASGLFLVVSDGAAHGTHSQNSPGG